MVEVTQEDRNAYDDLMSDDLYDHPPHAVWYFTRHRIAALAAKEAEIAKLREALEFIAEEHDAGRHDGLPEPCPAHDDVTMWATARQALKETDQ